jgi:hypothetical protein
MTDTTMKLLKTAHMLDGQIIDAAMDGNQKWQQKNQMLNKAHKSVHDAIDTLILMAVAEGIGQDTIITEMNADLTDETEDDE